MASPSRRSKALLPFLIFFRSFYLSSLSPSGFPLQNPKTTTFMPRSTKSEGREKVIPELLCVLRVFVTSGACVVVCSISVLAVCVVLDCCACVGSVCGAVFPVSVGCLVLGCDDCNVRLCVVLGHSVMAAAGFVSSSRACGGCVCVVLCRVCDSVMRVFSVVFCPPLCVLCRLSYNTGFWLGFVTIELKIVPDWDEISGSA